MGVIGFSGTMREAKPPVHAQFSKHDRSINHLVVDGNSFMHFCAQKINWGLGSPYSDFAQIVQQESQTLCNHFHPLFLFDGPLPYWKVDQRISRDQAKIDLSRTIVDDVVAGRCPRLETSILPPLALSVTLTTLRSLAASIEIAHGEADLAIARRARELNALVLSTDSDFYIHKGIKGYIPFESLRGVSDQLIGTVWTRRTVAESLGIKESLLPVVAALAGCDYLVLPEGVENVIETKILTVPASKRNAVRKVRGFVAYLQRFGSVAEAMDDLVSKFPDDVPQQLELRNALENVIRLYEGGDHGCEISAIPKTGGGAMLVAKVDEGRYSHKLVEALNGIFWCQSFVEDILRSSAWECSSSIRKWVYFFLNWSWNFPHEAAHTLPSEPAAVVEYIRRGSEVRRETVSHVTKEQVLTVCPNTNFVELPLDVRLEIYFRCMGVPHPTLLTKWTPLISCLKHLSNSPGIHFKNFELVAFVCTALKSSNSSDSQQRKAATLSTTPPHISRNSIHLCAQLETILLSSQLLSQTLLLADTPLDDLYTWDQAHWNYFDSQMYHRILQQAKMGSGLEKMIPSSLVGDFFGIWNEFKDLESIEVVIEYDFDHNQTASVGGGGAGVVTGGGPVRRKKKRGKRDQVAPNVPVANMFAILGDS
ncbi:Protein asteroid 1 [Chytridiales sp. JEL 0842]|nr:Protein asteroid 1 [Chytridiales sp. JEL 0842]